MYERTNMFPMFVTARICALQHVIRHCNAAKGTRACQTEPATGDPLNDDDVGI